MVICELEEGDDHVTQEKEEDEEEGPVKLWRNPCTTLYYCAWQLWDELRRLAEFIREHKIVISACLVVLTSLILLLNLDGPQQKYTAPVNKVLLWCLWWLFLGVLSSVGLGTGLHTFLLYLGPHVATVTMAAWECSSVDFPEPPYPETVICPDPDTSPKQHITLWTIIWKVELEAFMWGAGTAIGELPPYFMARTARLTGSEIDDEEFAELQKLTDKSHLPWSTRCKLAVQRVVERAGFFGILLCASIPNPLFDLAGITCGYLLIPFSTFFSAVLLGKAIFKVQLQVIMIILIFTADNLARLEDFIASIPGIGGWLSAPVNQFLEHQREKLHGSTGADVSEGTPVLSILFNVLIAAMILFFLLSIIQGLARQKQKQLQRERYPPLLSGSEDSDHW